MFNSIFSNTSRLIKTIDITGTGTYGTNSRGNFGNTVLPEALFAYTAPATGSATVIGNVYKNGKSNRSITLGSAFNSTNGYPIIKNNSDGIWWWLNWYQKNTSGNNASYGSPTFKHEGMSTNISATSFTNAGEFVDFSNFAINGKNALLVSRHNISGSATKNNYYYYYNASTNTWSDGNAPAPTSPNPVHIGIIDTGFFLLWLNSADLYYSYFNGTSWTTPAVVLTNASLNGATTFISSLSIDNHLRITARWSSGIAIITRSNTGTWTMNVQSGYPAPYEASIIEVGSNALLHWYNGSIYILAVFTGSAYSGIISPGGGTNWSKIIKLKDNNLFIELTSGIPQIIFNPSVSLSGITGTTRSLKVANNVSTYTNFVSSGKNVTYLSGWNGTNTNEQVVFLRR